MDNPREDSQVSEQKKQAKRKSLSRRFNLSFSLVYFITVLVTAPTIYFYTKQQVYSRAEKELELLVDVVKSIQSFVANDLRPHFMKEQIFYSPSFSGIVATSRIANYFNQEQPQYYISNSSDNPLNPDNAAEGLELELLNRFRNDRSLESLNMTGEIDSQKYLVSSAPKVSKKGCLRCHGEPEVAPLDVKETYSAKSGFGYKPGEVVGVSVVGVPLEDVQSLSVQRGLMIIGSITLLFAMLFLILNTLVRRLMLKPIISITTIAKAVSRGDVGREMPMRNRNDEIEDLAIAFELLRRSLVAAIKRMRRKPKQ
jgi:HAMP domain-containing protein